jgi:HK97 family phage portal protein
MGVIGAIETRTGSVNDPNMWINTLLESTNYATKSGTVITADTALKISTVYACITILAQTIASLPMTVNRRLPSGGNETAEGHWLYSVLHDTFNSDQTSYEAREMGIGHLKLRGNWYNRIERNGRGQIDGLWPMNPAFMQVFRMEDGVWYRYEPGNATDQLGTLRGTYSAAEIWHVKGYSSDGLTGLSTISYARESMGLTQALQDFTAEFFGRKAVPGNVLKHPGHLSAPALKGLKDSLEEYSAARRHKVLVLEEGMEWQSVGISNRDAQFLELSGAQIRDIARWFNVPLILLQEPDKVSTYASAEQFFLSFVKHTIWPITRRLEASANRALLTASERAAGYYVKFNLKGLLEGDFATRMNGYRIGRDGGWYSANDIRALEDMSPIDNGDIYLQPSNFIEAGTEPEPPPAVAPAIAPDPNQPDGEGQ